MSIGRCCDCHKKMGGWWTFLPCNRPPIHGEPLVVGIDANLMVHKFNFALDFSVYCIFGVLQL